MAKRGNAKGYDFHSLTADEKSKVQYMSDTFPEMTKEKMKIILQYYDFDQDKATDAITKDGGLEALHDYQNMETTQIKVTNKRKNKNKKKNKKESTSTASVIDADDSSSLHSSNIDFDGEKEASARLDDTYDIVEKNIQDNQSMCNNELEITRNQHILVGDNECNVDRNDTPDEEEKLNGVSPPLDIDSVENSIAENERLSPKDDIDDQSRHSSKHSGRQRHGSSRHSKSSSISEDHSSQSSNTVKNRNYDKNKRDLNRQSVSLTNIQSKVENKLEEANRSLKNAFTEIRNLLDKRQEELQAELLKVKNETTNLLKSRQDLAADLKLRMDRSPTVSDSDWLELKSDIKQFVTERKYDEQLGKTTWFCWSMDTITEEIRNFGEVTQVKNTYSQKSSQNRSNPDLNQNELDTKPSISLSKDNSMGDMGQEKGNKTEKEVSPKPNQNQGETKYRVFSNTNFQQNNRGFNPNRSRGYHGRGNMGNYRGNRYDNNYQPFRQYRGGHTDYRQQYSQGYVDKSMEGESNNPPRFQRNNPRHNRASQNSSYRSRGQRPYVQNRYKPRLNVDDPPAPPAENENVAEKPEVNGFTEESS